MGHCYMSLLYNIQNFDVAMGSFALFISRLNIWKFLKALAIIPKK